MVHSQAQGLLLESDEGRRALVTARNFPVGPPGARIRRHGAPARGPAAGAHGAPDALSQTPRQGLVRRDGVRSLAHLGLMWVASGPPAALRNRAQLGLPPVHARREAAGLAVMLHF